MPELPSSLSPKKGAVIVSLLAFCGACQDPPSPGLAQPVQVVQDQRLQHPSDITKFKGRYVATELYRNRLAIFDSVSLDKLEYLDPSILQKRFKAPHLLAVTPWDTLLISNGWGSSIVEISDLQGNGWREFKGIGKKFKAPHGLCVDDAGWIYVADSLNSRLVRFRDMNGSDWQVFADVDNKISYIRQLQCGKGTVLAANSYENKPGLNTGKGGNVLKITDFDSGKAEVVFSVADANLTGVAPLDDRQMVVGLWANRRQLAVLDLDTQKLRTLERSLLGVPYGIYKDPGTHQLWVTHLGELPHGNKPSDNIGGIALYPLPERRNHP